MKKLYLLALILAFSLSSYAQTSLEPNPVSVENFNADDFEAVAYSNVTNDGSSIVIYSWTRNVIEMTEGWTSAICDLNQCYLEFVSTQEFILPPGEVSNIDVHVYPDGIEGSALIEVTVEDTDNPENAVTGVYLFSTGFLSTPERINNALKIYPNPVVSEFIIQGADMVERIEIYNISGKLVKEIQSFGQGSINVDNLGTGNYIVRMWSDANVQLSTNVLTVQ
ncbi:MAG TPA: T9SS type A sorting domain-containing protein [Cryomorphaceae bacterium]|nr:T9SS type A sorting domain-containing protein [Cryomorphaceae bacterium]